MEMSETHTRCCGVWTGAVLGVLLSIIVMLLWRYTENMPRYQLYVLDAAQEIYMLDIRTGMVYITSAEVVRNYEDEMWALLNPLAEGKTVPMKLFLDQQQAIELRRQLLKEKQVAVKE